MTTMIKNLALVLVSFSLMGNSSKLFETILEEEIEILEIMPPEKYKVSTHMLIEKLAIELEIDPDNLVNLIHFETAGTFDPTIGNHKSSAKGLIQFTDATARTLKKPNGEKYSSSQNLIDECPTVECQLAKPNKNNFHGGPVYQYFKKFGKFKHEDDIFMAVFYPNAIGNPNFQFNSNVTDVNSGIKQAKDYIELAKNRLNKEDKYYD